MPLHALHMADTSSSVKQMLPGLGVAQEKSLGGNNFMPSHHNSSAFKASSVWFLCMKLTHPDRAHDLCACRCKQLAVVHT